LPKPYILVVDDFPDGRDMLAEYLTFRGFEVETADGGLEAFERTIARPPALVLMDLMMPGVDGWEATRRLKADPRTKDVIVIALTARTFTQDVVHVRAAGADGFVSKPFDIARLVDAITTIVENGRSGLSALATLAGGFDLST
jgi:two-component system cell cycle response regulator DivK